ncbi:MAG: dihydrofolate reductase [Pseudorhodoplanes sp.]|nr:dihydrofolate reductase [Pseudorhodoplanes sp.]
MAAPLRIEGYVIVSEDGMIADATGVMPPSLVVPADQAFFERGLDRADVVVHGRHSQESHTNSARRKRIILTRSVSALKEGPAPLSVYWNPAGASFEQALAMLGVSSGLAGIIGGTEVFGLFLPRYAAFHLTRAAGVRLPGGRPVFPQVPACTPDEVLLGHGLRPGPAQRLDAARDVSVVTWEPMARTGVG